MQIYKLFLKPKNYFDEISIKIHFIAEMAVMDKTNKNVGNDVAEACGHNNYTFFTRQSSEILTSIIPNNYFMRLTYQLKQILSTSESVAERTMRRVKNQYLKDLFSFQVLRHPKTYCGAPPSRPQYAPAPSTVRTKTYCAAFLI